MRNLDPRSISCYNVYKLDKIKTMQEELKAQPVDESRQPPVASVDEAEHVLQEPVPNNSDSDFIAGIQSVEDERERTVNDRLEIIFAPTDTANTTIVDYDALFSDKPSEGSVEAAAVRPTSLPVTDKTRAVAEGRLADACSKDSQLKSMLDGYSATKGLVGINELTDAIRTDKSLRLEIGKYLLDKIQLRIYEMPDRIARNTEKNPNAPGYSHISGLRSQEYTARLALAMIDGTFDDERAGSDVVTISSASGKAELGQHRAGAQILLN
jgi:hypothetical protein